jgi:uncharacterized repeat protein (TIGR04138 family)
MGSEWSFWDAVDRIRDRDPRFRREAYGFVVAALGDVVETLPEERRQDPVRRHLTGEELVRGVIALARREFGPLAPTVFGEWGVTRGEDIGEIVFQLVGEEQLSARPEDTIEAFRDGPDLLQALAAPGPSGPGVRARGGAGGATH